MKERRKSKIQVYEAQVELERFILERFNAERQGFDNVDGEDRWALDPFEEDREC